jgi:hypothetical protein
MNRHEFYRPLGERTLVNYQVQYLARRYDFGKESLVARLLPSNPHKIYMGFSGR